MVPEGWRKGLFEEGIELISGQHVEADLVNNKGLGSPYLTGPADFPNGNIVVSKYTSRGKKFSKKGDLLITVKGSGTGKVIKSDNEYAISRQLMAIRPTKFDSNFTFYNLVASIGRYEGAAAGLIPGISRDDVLHTPLLIPPLSEQNKIAQILSTWDKAITTTEQLLANSQQQKKALMQQLLTGKKRLLDESGVQFSGEWSFGHLGEICKITKGKALSSKNLVEGQYPVIAGGKTSPYRHCDFTHDKVITVSASGAYAGYVAYHPYKLWASDCSVVENINDSDICFIYQLMSYLQPKIYSLQSGGAQPHVYPKDLLVLKVQIPSFEEQQRITDVLSTADKEINALQQKVDKLKQEKKALMQQLLTGKRRVKIEETA